MAAPFRVVALIAAYNEEDFIGEVIADLISQGVSVYLIDNHSTDGTVEQAKPFLERGLIGIEKFPDAPSSQFDWTGLLHRKEELATSLPATWFIHTDADEFRESPWADANLSEAIARVDEAGYSAIDFALFNFWPTREDGPLEEGVKQALRYCEPGSPSWADRQVKCWKNLGAPVNLAASGGHDVGFEGRRVFPIRFPLRHYPIRSNEHGQRKVFKERRPRFKAIERQRAWHIQYDEFEHGCDFTRDPGTLRLYRSEDVRMELALHNRLVEQRTDELAQSRTELAQSRTELTQSQTELAQARAGLGDVQTRETQARSELTEAQAALSEARAEVERIRAERLQKDGNARAAQAALEELRRVQKEEVERREGELARAHDQLAESIRDVAGLERDREFHSQEVAAARAALEELQRSKEQGDNERRELEQSATRRLHELEREHARQLERARAEMETLQRAREQIIVELTEARSGVEELRRLRTDDLERHRLELAADQGQLERRLEEAHQTHVLQSEEWADAHRRALDELRGTAEASQALLKDALVMALDRQRAQLETSRDQLAVELRTAHLAQLAKEEARHAAELTERDQTRDRELARLREVVAEQLAQKAGDIERFREALEGRTRDLRHSENEMTRLQGELERTNEEIAHLTEDLNRVFTSKSWRVSSLGRSAWRLLGRG